MNVSRRNFLKLSAGSVALASSATASAKAADTVVIPKRKFGRHDDMLSVVGLGGHTLYLSGSQKEANELVARALDRGINFFDNSWDYHDGEAEEYMGVAMKGRRDEVFLMSKFCNYHMSDTSNGYTPDVKGAMKMLEDSLRRLQTDYLDLWMMHNVADDDLEEAYRKEGAIEAIELAKKQGKVRYSGFSGHTNVQLHCDLINQGYAWDATLMPVSSVGALQSQGYESKVMPLCEEKNIAVLGMKGFGGSRRTNLHGKTNAETVLKYSLSYSQVCTHLIGMDKMDYLDQAIAASVVTPFTTSERKAYAARFDFAPDSPEYAAQFHGGKLYESGSCCSRRDACQA